MLANSQASVDRFYCSPRWRNKRSYILFAVVYSGTPLRPKAARVEPHTHTTRRPKRHAGNFLWSLASGMTRGRVRTYVAFHDILTCSNFCAAASQWRARNRVSLLTGVAQATRVEVK